MFESVFVLFVCEAAVAWGAAQPLVIEEVEVGPPQPFEIRVKVVSTSLCRSDISAWESQVSLSFSLFSSFRFCFIEGLVRV